MKKRVLILLALLILLPLAPVRAKDYTCSFTGTTAAYTNGFINARLSFDGEGIDNIKGEIHYNADALVLFAVQKNEELTSWGINFDTSQPGVIQFNAALSDGSDKLNSSTVLIELQLVVCSEALTNTAISTANVVTTVTKVEEVVTNQQEIDDARSRKENAMGDEGSDIVIPDPIIEKHTSTEEFTFADDTLDVSVSRKVSGDNYLKAVTVEGGTLSPTFSKPVTNYKITVPAQTDQVDLSVTPESPYATAIIADEVNDQIIVTVTSEDQQELSYIFTVVRQDDYVAPDGGGGTVISTYTTTEIVLLALLGLVSLALIVMGGIYVWRGSHQ